MRTWLLALFPLGLLILATARADEARELESELDAFIDSRGFAAERLRDSFPTPFGPLELSLTGSEVRGTPTSLLPAIESPYLTAGPLALGGALRELSDPLSSGPSATYVRERSEVRLDRSFQPGRRLGFVLSPFPRRLDLFWLSEAGGPTMVGGLARGQLPELSEGSLYVLASLPARQQRTASWFLDAPLVDSPYITYGGGKLVARSAPFEAGVSGALSFSPVVPPGGYLGANLGCRWRLGWVSAAAKAATPTFLLPDGGMSERLAVAGGLSELLLPFGALRVEAQTALDRLPLLPVGYRESDEEARIELVTGESPLRLRLSYGHELAQSREGRRVLDEELAGGLVWSCHGLRCTLRSKFSWSNLYEPSQSLEGSVVLAPSRVRDGPTLELEMGVSLPGGRTASSRRLRLTEEGWNCLAGGAGVAADGLGAGGRPSPGGEASSGGAGGGGGSADDASDGGEAGGMPWLSRYRREPSFTGGLSASLPFGSGRLTLKVAIPNPVKFVRAGELFTRPLDRLVLSAGYHQESSFRSK